jgi:hypothetical protein
MATGLLGPDADVGVGIGAEVGVIATGSTTWG